MVGRRIRIQLTVFVLIAALSMAFLGLRYVGFARWIGVSGYTVHVDLPQTGGAFTNAEVTYRGVPVGRIHGLRLTSSGTQADLRIDSGHRIPADVQAVVADRSVIGEQYLDLRPRSSGGPYLHDGSTIRQADTALPPPVEDLLLSAESLATSVPIGALQTTIGELYSATQDIHGSLSTLATSNTAFFTSLDQVLPQTIALLDSGRTVLATQNSEAASITAFAHNLRLIGAQLRSSDGDLNTLLTRLAPATSQVTGLFNDISGSLHDLLSNLLTTSVVFLGQRNGVREVLVDLPVAVTIGGMVTTPQGINVGLVPTFFDPLPCTQGYGRTAVRSGLNTAGGVKLNTAAGCTSSTGDARGSQHAPGG